MPLSGLRLAVTLLTAIPLPDGRGDGAGTGRAPSRRAAGAAMTWAPAVGLLLGAAAAAVLELAARWARTGPLLAAVLAVAALALPWACRRGVPAARGTGLGALVAGTVSPAVPVVLTVATLAAAYPLGIMVVVGVAAGLAASLALTALAVRRLGGITGDVLGALVEVATAVCLLACAIS
jgi:adenosylcobinamide-GDP ribazoletransferase